MGCGSRGSTPEVVTRCFGIAMAGLERSPGEAGDRGAYFLDVGGYRPPTTPEIRAVCCLSVLRACQAPGAGQQAGILV